MATMMESINDNTELKRFELEVSGETAFAEYRLNGQTLYIDYVEAPEPLRGTGAAGHLMTGIVEIARAHDYRIVPICGYAVAWLKRHADQTLAKPA